MRSMTHHLIIFGDSREMREVDDESVHLIVTSPPYWCIKDYQHPQQIGCVQTYDEYLNALSKVFGECRRVLKPGCRLAVNIGDQYLRATHHGRYRVLPIPADLTRIVMELGMDFMGAIIWRKMSTTKTSGGCCWMGSTYYPGDGHITYEHEYILLFRKLGKRPVVKALDIRERSRLTKAERSAWFRGVWDDISPERQVGHIAMFPVELPRRLIRMYTYVGETVLDPFLGSGTTSRAAMLEERNSIGYEINEAFEPLIRRKITQYDPNLFEHHTPPKLTIRRRNLSTRLRATSE